MLLNSVLILFLKNKKLSGFNQIDGENNKAVKY